MKNFLKIAMVAAFTGVFFFTCKKDDPVVFDLNFGYNYVTDEVGRYVIYEVDSIAYDDNSHLPDTFRYLLKEIIDTTFIDNSGKPALKLDRYYKFHNDTVPYSLLPWTGPRVWYANKTSTDYQKVEENIRYLRLVFPPDEGKQWDGNLYNTLISKEYEIMAADQYEVVNSIGFDSVLTVKQFERDNPIEYKIEIEKYARNVGLVYKEMVDLYDGGGDDTVGYSYIQKIVSYGKE